MILIYYHGREARDEYGFAANPELPVTALTYLETTSRHLEVLPTSLESFRLW